MESRGEWGRSPEGGEGRIKDHLIVAYQYIVKFIIDRLDVTILRSSLLQPPQEAHKCLYYLGVDHLCE